MKSRLFQFFPPFAFVFILVFAGCDSTKQTAAMPAFSLKTGTFYESKTVKITDSTSGAAIYYTTDGSTPTTASTAYSGAITVAETETVKAIASAKGYNDSEVASTAYTIMTPGLEVLYGAARTARLNYFETLVIDPDTGGFSKWTSGAAPVLGTNGMATVNYKFMYISFPQLTGVTGNGEVIGYSLDSTTGKATELAGSPFFVQTQANPQGIAVVPDQLLFYVADTGNNNIHGYSVNSTTGVPTEISGSPFASGTTQQITVDPSGKYLYAANQSEPGGVLAYSIGSTGALTAVAGSPFSVKGQTAADSAPFGILDTGSFVYITLAGTNQIAAFSIDSSTGALTAVAGSPFTTGNNPTLLAQAKDFLYAVNTYDGTISGYQIDDTTGALTEFSGSPFASGVNGIIADPTGSYLYVSRFDNILGYNIDATTGALTLGPASLGGINSGLWMTIVQYPATSTP
jgi:DNA-binding beta-propeller fold protein YncE